ncbi:hypothetical protein F442_19332 [Phytophthora nicotianae P10297]|uniref:U2A'/phosphoprotein 32 family A C-terminal domain-containing protein n=4 Tax=Phytophthora nicotianae TaxID=4792 RepID=W2QZU2_PHYN3|nr:hypothetical protein PPTG_05620 [Phytophthora nicotianae INRA-310]ETL80843.1 hypothetical protein L917_18704 [Phytophthora nicotianae]ETO62634.1 hypothetical protein F444_19512 [Phytophthora nicotianae P1976]ETP31856.1 hypothetical protein F442_19332 [Phytophthora nicotianae P10297]KUG01384.1 phosphatase 1 regulatory subunit 42 protein [Phytophthora nicotianae]ETM34047.1 hypothetical protein L914_18794 [Phytophthora nicotianae]
MQSLDADSNQHDAETHCTGGGREITIEVLLHATKLSVGKKEHLSHYLKRITHLALNGDASKALMKGGSDPHAIHKIQNLHHCPNLKVLYLYDNEIETIENLDVVPHLAHLHLQGNCLRRIENLESLRLLEKLYLEKNSIVRLERLTGCSRLQELYLANQNVPIDTHFSFEEDTMRNLACSLRILDLSSCRVASTKPLTLLRCLEQLDLSKNLISDLEEIFALVGGVTSLVELDLRGNEVTAAPKYREKTITFSSARLALLDKKDIDPNQRRMMQSHLAHKYRKRLGPSSRRQSPSSSERKRSDLSSGPSESTRPLKHGATVHQLRSMQFTSTHSKLQSDSDGLGIAGSSCNPNSTALLRSSNNKYH